MKAVIQRMTLETLIIFTFLPSLFGQESFGEDIIASRLEALDTTLRIVKATWVTAVFLILGIVIFWIIRSLWRLRREIKEWQRKAKLREEVHRYHIEEELTNLSLKVLGKIPRRIKQMAEEETKQPGTITVYLPTSPWFWILTILILLTTGSLIYLLVEIFG